MSLFGWKYLRATWPPLRHDWKLRGTWAMLKDLYQMREFKYDAYDCKVTKREAQR